MVQILLDGQPRRLRALPSTGGELLSALGVSPQEALIKVDGRVRPPTAPLSAGQRIEVIRVVFGG